MINKTEKEIMALWDSKYNAYPMVSIRCMTYNHQKQIGQAIDSFLMQETSFPFEIIVHDDCSTDGTIEILKGYEECYPNIVRVFYEKENQYSKPGGLLAATKIVKAECKGKYRATCEGDDYWISTDKLQKQYNMLEQNPELSVCVCKTYIDSGKSSTVYLENNIPPRNFDITTDRRIGATELAEMIFGNVPYPFHTSGYFFTKEFDLFDGLDQLRKYTEGDEVILRKAIFFGGVYYINEVMSCYRWLTEDGWTNSYFSKTVEDKYIHAKNQAKANKLFDELTDYSYHCLIQKKNFLILMSWIFAIDSRKVISDIDEIIGKDVSRVANHKERLIYMIARIMPCWGPRIYKIYKKLKGH